MESIFNLNFLLIGGKQMHLVIYLYNIHKHQKRCAFYIHKSRRKQFYTDQVVLVIKGVILFMPLFVPPLPFNLTLLNKVSHIDYCKFVLVNLNI